MKFFVPIAQAAIIGGLSWLMVSVSALQRDVAVLKWQITVATHDRLALKESHE